MRDDLSAALLAQIVATRGRPIYFVEFVLPSATVRYTTNPDSITHRSQSWTHQDFEVGGLRYDGQGNNSPQVIFENVSKQWAATFRQEGTEGSAATIRASDGLLSAAEFLDDEASGDVHVSIIRKVSVTDDSVTLQLGRRKVVVGTERCDRAHGFTDVTAPGVSQYPSGAQVLV